MKTTLALLALTAALTGCGEVMVAPAGGATTGGSSTTGDPGDDPPLPHPPPSAVAACDFAAPGDPAKVVMTWSRDTSLVLVRADGSTFVAHTYDPWPGQVSDASISLYVAARGDFVAAAAMGYYGSTERWEATLMKTSGEIVWTGVEPAYQYHPQHLSAAGWLAIRLFEQNSTLVVSPDGAEMQYPNTEPLAAPTAAGTLFVRVLDTGEMGWLDLASGAITPLAYPLAAIAPRRVIRDGVVYAAEIDGEVTLVRELAGEIATVASPIATPTFESVAPNGILVVGDGSFAWQGTRWVVDIGAGTVTAMPQPEELWAFGYDYYFGWSVDEDGGALGAIRNDVRGGLYRISGAEGAWSPVGGTYNEIWDVGFVARAGTFVVQPSDEAGYFPMDPWAPTPEDGAGADYTGPLPQVARLSDGAHRGFPEGASNFAVSGDGRCVAFVGDGALHVMEIGDDFPIADLPAGVAERAGTPVWIVAE